MGKKLIEVAPFLPLDAISVASKADKDKKTGTIKNVHKWFAPMPTPAIRALIFAAVVDAPADPEEHEELLRLIERLVPSDGNPPNKRTLEEANEVIRSATSGELPTIFDPFCGGGSTLIEAQRLGLPAQGSDLNPVPALITRTLTQLVPAAAGRSPVVGDPAQLGTIGGGHLDGLVADIRHYSERVRSEAWDRVGHLYPQSADGGTVVAQLWTWTAKCPNPTCRAVMPLVSSMWLSKKKGQERWLKPEVDGVNVTFEIGAGEGPSPPPAKVGRGAKFRCLACGEVADDEAIKDYGSSKGLGNQLLATVVDHDGERRFVVDPPPPQIARPDSAPQEELPDDTRAMWCKLYGIETYADVFTPRQLVMLNAFADVITLVPGWVRDDGGDGPYADAVASVLGLGLGKLAQTHSTQSRWYIDNRNGSATAQAAFSRHALPMVWDFVELNPFAKGVVGDWLGLVDTIARGMARLPNTYDAAIVRAADARSVTASLDHPVVVVTDPPYFDQIGYADLSDFFYVWHRRALRGVHPDLYRTIVAPKDEELIATPHRHNGEKAAATRYFIDGFTETFKALREGTRKDYPILIVYAHRQEEKSSLGSASTGWDAMLEAVLEAGLTIEGTLPIRGTGSSRQIGQGTNSLASYIVMVCRPRGKVGQPGTIADFRSALRTRLPKAANRLLETGESMVDIRQAAIGPGMEVFSRFSTVFDGNETISVRRALTIINEELGRILDEQLGHVDDETRWACQWYSDHAFEQGEYDEARKGAQTYGLGVDGIEHSGIIESTRGRVRLLPRAELPAGWAGDDRTPLWEALQHLVARLTEGADAGEESAAELLAELGSKASGAKELAQFLTNLAIEKGWSEEAIAYDALVKSWPRVEQNASARSTRNETLL